MYNIATLNKISPIGLNDLTDDYKIIDNTDDAHGIIVRSQNMKDMDFSDDLLCIARAGVGVNNIPVDRCAEKGIVVFNTPGGNANAVKEMVIASLVIGSRNLFAASEWARSLEPGELSVAKQVEKGKSQFKGTEIKDRTVGIIGLGGIGGLVANACVHLGMNVIGYDRYLSVKNALHLSKHLKVVDKVADMLPLVDFLTVHVHANDETNGMINEDIFNEIKQGAILLNFSRASIVDIPSLRIALEHGVISRYVTDFPDEDSLSLPNTIVTPHLGASTDEAEDNCARMAVDELMDFIENGNITNSVTIPNVNMGRCRAASRISLFHKNIPNMIGRITGAVSELNISDMTNRSCSEYAYTLLDLDSPISEEAVGILKNIEGMIRVRVIK